jgi:hypothetical protein
MLENYISRIVAFVVAPLATAVAPVVANAVQDYAGVNLDGGELAAYLVSVAVGTALAAYKWLEGRKEWEIAVEAVDVIEGLHDAGEDAFGQPTVPPGVER